MNHFYVLKLPKWKRKFIIVLFSFFAAFFLWFERDGVFSALSSNKTVALSKGNPNQENIALTFNISWGEEKVHGILDQLASHNVQATFFLSGEWAERHPDIVEKIIEGKHEIGMLGYEYKSYVDQDIEQVQKDLFQAQEVFEKIGLKDLSLLRPPNGHLNKEIISLAKQHGYQVVHWNMNPNDWENPGTEVIVDQVMKETKNGDIVLLHASDAAKQTAKALEIILPGLNKKGFSFISISEMISQIETESKIVE